MTHVQTSLRARVVFHNTTHNKERLFKEFEAKNFAFVEDSTIEQMQKNIDFNFHHVYNSLENKLNIPIHKIELLGHPFLNIHDIDESGIAVLLISEPMILINSSQDKILFKEINQNIEHSIARKDIFCLLPIW
jgi:hypothetical protein